MFSLVLVGTFNKLEECLNSFNIVQTPNSKKKKKKSVPTNPSFISPLHQYNIFFLLALVWLISDSNRKSMVEFIFQKLTKHSKIFAD